MLDKYFNYKKHKTNFKTEVIAEQQRSQLWLI